jgi:predicted Zn-dependent protease
MKQTLLILALACMTVGDSIASEDFDTVTHKIPPGYEPKPERDEQGLWSEMEDLELAINKSALLLRTGDLVDYINTVVCRVAGPYCADLRVYVIRNPNFNASMAPNGMMQIWTGLIVRASSTDEIAAVVGHEIAHYTRLHSLQQLRALKNSMTAGAVFDMALALTTGVDVPVGQLTAMFRALAFSREQESEADFLGTKLMADAEYDPHANYIVWQKILAEEKAAVAKGRKPAGFVSTHPPSDKRAARLEALVTERYGPSSIGQLADQALLDVLNSNYIMLMEDQLDTNRYGRTLEILRRHAEIGVDMGLVNFFYGETYRQRGADGDHSLAMAAYNESIASGNAPAEAYKNLGYLLLKEKDRAAAREAFTQYLDLAPDASDRAMIEFYLEDLS